VIEGAVCRALTAWCREEKRVCCLLLTNNASAAVDASGVAIFSVFGVLVDKVAE
jgi:hypothetical protein